MYARLYARLNCKHPGQKPGKLKWHVINPASDGVLGTAADDGEECGDGEQSWLMLCRRRLPRYACERISRVLRSNPDLCHVCTKVLDR